MSVEHYAKLERSNLAGVSPAVLEAVARALRLDDAERAHLLHLAQAADGSDALTRPRRRTSRQWTPHRSLQWTLDAITAGRAFVRNGPMDLLAANQLAHAFYSDVYAAPGNQANLARCNFLDPASRRFYPDWDEAADIAVAILPSGRVTTSPPDLMFLARADTTPSSANQPNRPSAAGMRGPTVRCVRVAVPVGQAPPGNVARRPPVTSSDGRSAGTVAYTGRDRGVAA
ncbi:hypothetical protein ACFYXS_06560 [Streptomyces sp. NPDC002574]|uniref:MmyB family transcriptional regulator n=1 Tax=Streptomyces sp. NPDC002574 TaxID=3364652 RepID=UPI0036918077